MEKQNKSRIDQFIDLSMEAFANHENELFEIMDIDKESYLTDCLNHVKQLKLKSMAHQKKVKNEKLKTAVVTKIYQIFQSDDEGKISKVEQLFRKRNVNVALFHNIKKLSKQDLESMLEDQYLLEIIEDLDNMKEEK
ncbi:MAG TPA: hypothetical protein PLO31_08705 [Dysgonamonadaceae bacterium]|jgi:hypothetical protein|nr:hypothetical protein [Dysgonamonadaceae bacterium]